MNSERVNERIDLLKFDLLTALGIYTYRVNKAVNSNKELFVSFSVCSASHPLPPGACHTVRDLWTRRTLCSA